MAKAVHMLTDYGGFNCSIAPRRDLLTTNNWETVTCRNCLRFIPGQKRHETKRRKPCPEMRILPL